MSAITDKVEKQSFGLSSVGKRVESMNETGALDIRRRQPPQKPNLVR